MLGLSGESLNLTEYNLDKIKEIFPEVFCEGKIDFDKLRLILGDSIENKEERYEFTWNGKNDAIRIAQTPSTGTLRPDKESSKNWDDTENLYIEGDNLEVLKLLQKSYFGKIKMIYIDPPYNTGKDFVYKDNFRDNIANYKEITNQSTKANPETNGRYHTDWLNMIYPRLKLARNLLREDGVIFISIDDNEIDNLKKLCNEIFGEKNYIGSIVRRRRKSQANLSKNISIVHEYTIIYSKLNDEVLNKVNDNIDINDYKNPDDDSRGPYVTMPCTNKGGAKYSVKTSTGKVIEEEWRFKKETYYKLLKENRIVFPKSGDGKPRYKLFLDEKLKEGIIVNSWWDNISSNQEATVEIKNLFAGHVIFDTPKPIDFIKRIIKIGGENNAIVLDFFSGSSTTAHAVINLNCKNNSNIKYIMVQLPELTNEKSEAYKLGYKNICEIGKERIRRAGDKIVSENKDKEGIEKLDIGFKVFKLDSSNLKSWDSSMENLEENIIEMDTNLKKDRSNEDLLYEILLKSGVELTAKIEKIKVGYNILYNIGEGALLACLDDKITQDVIDEIPKHKSLFMETKVIFKEVGFMSDAAKINAIQNLKQFKIEDVRSV